MNNKKITLIKSLKTFKTTASFMILGLISSGNVMSETVNPEDIPIPECTEKSVVSFKFNDIALSSVMMLAANAEHVEVTGTDLLGDRKISTSAECVDAVEFAVALMLVHGFDLHSDENGWIITKS